MQRISTINQPYLEELRNWCRNKVPLMGTSYSKLAKNRYELWLFHKVHLRTGEITKGYSDDYIQSLVREVYPDSNIGLLTFGGEFDGITSSGLISPHKDAKFAKAIAKTINLGTCIFSYENSSYQLNDGEIIEFNSKVLHGVREVLSPERFSINLWQLDESKGYFPLV